MRNKPYNVAYFSTDRLEKTNQEEKGGTRKIWKQETKSTVW